MKDFITATHRTARAHHSKLLCLQARPCAKMCVWHLAPHSWNFCGHFQAWAWWQKHRRFRVHTERVCFSGCGLGSAMFSMFLYFFLETMLFGMAPGESAKARGSDPKCKKAALCLAEKTVLDEPCPGPSRMLSLWVPCSCIKGRY